MSLFGKLRETVTSSLSSMQRSVRKHVRSAAMIGGAALALSAGTAAADDGSKAELASLSSPDTVAASSAEHVNISSLPGGVVDGSLMAEDGSPRHNKGYKRYFDAVGQNLTDTQWANAFARDLVVVVDANGDMETASQFSGLKPGQEIRVFESVSQKKQFEAQKLIEQAGAAADEDAARAEKKRVAAINPSVVTDAVEQTTERTGEPTEAEIVEWIKKHPGESIGNMPGHEDWGFTKSFVEDSKRVAKSDAATVVRIGQTTVAFATGQPWLGAAGLVGIGVHDGEKIQTALKGTTKKINEVAHTSTGKISVPRGNAVPGPIPVEAVELPPVVASATPIAPGIHLASVNPVMPHVPQQPTAPEQPAEAHIAPQHTRTEKINLNALAQSKKTLAEYLKQAIVAQPEPNMGAQEFAELLGQKNNIANPSWKNLINDKGRRLSDPRMLRVDRTYMLAQDDAEASMLVEAFGVVKKEHAVAAAALSTAIQNAKAAAVPATDLDTPEVAAQDNSQTGGVDRSVSEQVDEQAITSIMTAGYSEAQARALAQQLTAENAADIAITAELFDKNINAQFGDASGMVELGRKQLLTELATLAAEYGTHKNFPKITGAARQKVQVQLAKYTSDLFAEHGITRSMPFRKGGVQYGVLEKDLAGLTVEAKYVLAMYGAQTQELGNERIVVSDAKRNANGPVLKSSIAAWQGNSFDIRFKNEAGSEWLTAAEITNLIRAAVQLQQHTPGVRATIENFSQVPRGIRTAVLAELASHNISRNDIRFIKNTHGDGGAHIDVKVAPQQLSVDRYAWLRELGVADAPQQTTIAADAHHAEKPAQEVRVASMGASAFPQAVTSAAPLPPEMPVLQKEVAVANVNVDTGSNATRTTEVVDMKLVSLRNTHRMLLLAIEQKNAEQIQHYATQYAKQKVGHNTAAMDTKLEATIKAVTQKETRAKNDNEPQTMSQLITSMQDMGASRKDIQVMVAEWRTGDAEKKRTFVQTKWKEEVQKRAVNDDNREEPRQDKSEDDETIAARRNDFDEARALLTEIAKKDAEGRLTADQRQQLAPLMPQLAQAA